MSIKSLRAARQNYDANTYTGVVGEVFYNEATGEFRLCDAVTPGGNPIPITLATSTTAGSVKPSRGFSIAIDGTLTLNAGDMFTLDDDDIFQLLPATADTIGGVRLGPGVALNSESQLVIDSEGLDFTFGNLSSLMGTYSDSTSFAILSSLGVDEDIAIASNGTGGVKIVGEFEVYKTDNTIVNAIEGQNPIFRVGAGGQVKILVPTADEIAGAIEIIGSSSGQFHPPNQSGVILHTTGNTDSVNRIYHDAANNYPIIVGRRYNGDVGSLTPVLNEEVFFRIAGQASTGTDFETFGPAKISWIATEDQGPNNQGGKITIDVTANGTNAFDNVITVVEFTSDGVESSVGFIGDLTGNADTVTNGVYTTDTATVTNTMLAGSIANDKLINSSITLNNTVVNLGDTATISAAAGTLTGGTLASNVINSSLTSIANASNIIAGSVTIDPAIVNRDTALVQTFTLTGLTTNHKIVVTSGTALGVALFISAAWASAADTLSIEFQNLRGNQDVNLPPIDIQYFAWV